MPNTTPDQPGLSRYAALAHTLRERVVSGLWPPGQALPAESQLAADHGVALGTMRQAMALLAAQGYVERIHGKGTFVRQGLSGANLMRFFRFHEGDGTAPTAHILDRSIQALPEEAARALGLPVGNPALHLLRLRLLGGHPRLLENLWLPLDLFASLLDDDLDTWEHLLYPMYSRRFQVHVHHAQDRIGFGHLSAEQAQPLDLPANHPCVVVQRAAFDFTGRCIEARTTRGDALAFHYTVDIT
jgi:GntR family transcriptional regulator